MMMKFEAGDKVVWTKEAQERAARSRDMYGAHLVVGDAVGEVVGHWKMNVMVQWKYTRGPIPCNPRSLQKFVEEK